MTEPQYTPARPCAAPGCDKPARKSSPYCHGHYGQVRRNGTLGLQVRLAPPDLPDEQWRPVVGYEGLYTVSNLGRIRRVAPTPTYRCGQLLQPSDNGTGYVQVCLAHSGVHRYRYVHVLVAEAFLGPCPAGMEVNHIDLDRQNCRLTNLEYLTRPQNLAHRVAFRVGQSRPRRPFTPRSGTPQKLTEDNVRAIRASTEPAATLARRFGVDPSAIRQIRQRRIWKHVK